MPNKCDNCGNLVLVASAHKCPEPKNDDEKFTRIQQNAIHLWFRQIAKAWNEAGLSVPQVLDKFTMDLLWTEKNVKSVIAHTAIRRMFKKEHTSDLTKEEMSKLIDVMSAFLAKTEVDVPFPSEDEIS